MAQPDRIDRGTRRALAARRRVVAAARGVPVLLAMSGCTGVNPAFGDPEGNFDGGSGGATVRAPGCGEPPDAATVALFRFEDLAGAVMVDAVGPHDGVFVDGTPTGVAGPPGCGQAIEVSEPTYGLVESSSDFRLAAGSVDLWVRPPSSIAGRLSGIVSRDARGQQRSGHLTLYMSSVSPDRFGPWTPGHLVVRQQTTDEEVLRCTTQPLEPGQWVHVGINFGAPDLELYIDGVRQKSSAFGQTVGSELPCDGPLAAGIDGNDNPWVASARSTVSNEGEPEPVEDWFQGGAIDDLRISRARRSF